MAKLKKLDTRKITADAFDGTRSYGAALWAIDICNHIIERVNAGDIVFEYENLVVPKFELRWHKDGRFEGLYTNDGENAVVQIVGDVLGGPNLEKIYCTKKDIREYFKLWRVAKVVNVSRVTDLTK